MVYLPSLHTSRQGNNQGLITAWWLIYSPHLQQYIYCLLHPKAPAINILLSLTWGIALCIWNSQCILMHVQWNLYCHSIIGDLIPIWHPGLLNSHVKSLFVNKNFVMRNVCFINRNQHVHSSWMVQSCRMNATCGDQLEIQMPYFGIPGNLMNLSSLAFTRQSHVRAKAYSTTSFRFSLTLKTA